MIFIPGNVPSSKNSKQWTGKMLISSKTVRNYIKEHEKDWALYKNDFQKLVKNKPKPYKVTFYFIRDTKRKFDYINALQLPCDLMVKYGWLLDDNCDEIIPIIKGYEVDKKRCGVIIDVE